MRNPKFQCDRLIQVLDRTLAVARETKRRIEEGNLPEANHVQWVFDGHMASMEKEYRKLIKALEEER